MIESDKQVGAEWNESWSGAEKQGFRLGKERNRRIKTQKRRKIQTRVSILTSMNKRKQSGRI